MRLNSIKKNNLTEQSKKKKNPKRKWFIFLSVLSFLLSVVLIIALVIMNKFDNIIASYGGGSFWKLKNASDDAIYYASDFEDDKARLSYGDEVCVKSEEEGAVLLFNNDNTLPLEKGDSVSCFSNSSVNLVYGGTGSGDVEISEVDTLKDALEKVDLKVNTTLWDFYETGAGSDYKRTSANVYTFETSKLNEVPLDKYIDEVFDSVKNHSDSNKKEVAIIVLSRIGGEGTDLSYDDVNYLALNKEEHDLLKKIADLKAENVIGKTIVLLNSANAIQLDFLKDEQYAIDACMWIGDVGQSGINGVANLLVANTTPSGRLVDTFCKDNLAAPAMKNFTPTTYKGFEGEEAKKVLTEGGKDFFDTGMGTGEYIIYQEGIYVGYKYFETRYEDYVTKRANAGEFNYNDVVAYPFGYGMSYTNFEHSNMKVTYDEANDQFDIEVTVKNTGDKFSGKDVVEIYAQSPYTEYDIANNIEKSSVLLCGFKKSKLLKPGESEVLSITVSKDDLKSYDAFKEKTYILENGDYFLTAASNAHDAVNNILAYKGYTVDNTNKMMDTNGNKDFVYKWTNASFDKTTYSVSDNKTAITNQLSNLDINLYDSDNKITYVSRNNWEGTLPKETPILDFTDKIKDGLKFMHYNSDSVFTYDNRSASGNAKQVTSNDKVVTDAKNGLKLFDMIGLPYNDPKWNDLLDQMSTGEMISFVGDAFHWTMPVKSINAPGTRDENGPQGLTASFVGSDSTQFIATSLTSEDVMAASFNTELVEEIGKVIGNDCLDCNVAILYGTGNNLHRTPYGGRNYEYYSEDAFLSARMSAHQIAKIQEKGVKVTMKHFVLNDNETDRMGVGVWINEQAARETYLKAFQEPIEKIGASGVMTAYTRMGCTWSSANSGLITGILRNEWGCDGLVISDNIVAIYMNGVDGILAGTSAFDSMMASYPVSLMKENKDDPVIVAALKEASHHNLYTIANSLAMNRMDENTTIKLTQPTLIVVGETLLAVFVILFIMFTICAVKAKVKLS